MFDNCHEHLEIIHSMYIKWQNKQLKIIDITHNDIMVGVLEFI